MDNPDISLPAEKPISDDQELAKALAGVTQTPNVGDLTFEETPVIKSDETAPDTSATTPDDNHTVEPQTVDNSAEATQPIAKPVTVQTPTQDAPKPENLDEIKQDALQDLRPLVDKLDITPEEKFDIYLLLLRSTDDKTLVGPAYEAARSITDESARAQALFDVIKEVDYFSNPQAD